MNPLTTEQQGILYVIVGLGALTGIGSLIIQIIATFRRQPPAEAQFADREKNSEDHARLYRRVDALVHPDSTPFVMKAQHMVEEEQRKSDRDEMKRDLKVLLQRTAHLAGFGEDKA
jgi:hypothetical protein